MTDKKLVKQTLSMPDQTPFFSYNVNFDGLRSIIEKVSVDTNDNSNRIKNLQKISEKKLDSLDFQKMHKTMDQSFSLGINCEQYIEKHESLAVKISSKDSKELQYIERYCRKMQKMSEIVDMLLVKSKQHDQRLENDDKKNEKLISESFRRLQDKVDMSMESFNKTINDFFSETNKSVTTLDSSLNDLKFNSEFKLAQLTSDINSKVSEFGVKNLLESAETKIKKDLVSTLENDHMKRLSTLNEYSTKLKQNQKDLDLQQKAAKQRLDDMFAKVAKCMTNGGFEAEKHKIYEKFAEYRNKIDELNRKNFQFVEFRKQTMSNHEKVKQNFIAVDEEVKKLNSKESSFKKMENVSGILEALDPHLICEIGNEVKLHEKEIGKLQKQIMLQEYELKSIKTNNSPMPEVNSGQNADFLAKMIKQYMSNLDFDGRVKKLQRDSHELNKKSDSVHDLQKKIYLLTKELDINVIMKEIKRKADQESTFKDIRIIDGKIEKLFEFYKQVRKELEEYARRASKGMNDPYDKASMTTKKLYPPNCLSCTPTANPRRRHLSARNSKHDVTISGFEENSLEVLRNSSYLRPKRKE